MLYRRFYLSLAVMAPAITVLASGAVSAQVPASTASARPDYTAADVQFMQGMIGHHAQAVVMAGMAPTHGASPQIALFARKIARSQIDEIDLMQTWLRDRGQAVPDPKDPHAAMHAAMMDSSMKGMDMKDMDMKGMDMGGHAMLMPGMLSPAQMAQLDAARGTEFDRLFLTFMIQHHQGALTMVQTLFDTPGSGQGPEIFGYATGVDADQRAEIGRMQGMLATIGR